MRKWLLYLPPIIFVACHSTRDKSKNEILSCILLGYDTVAWYYGNSADMEGLVSGSLNDSAFVKRFITTAKKRQSLPGFKIVIKPTASANVGMDFKLLVDLLNDNDLDQRSLDSLDENEKIKFSATSPTEIIKHAQNTLILPADEDSGKYAARPADIHTLTILAFKDTGLYVYRGANIKAGKTYRYIELETLLSGEESNGSISILIKPASDNKYENTVSLLDEMANNNITDYKLVDITPEEEAFLKKVEGR